jgi:hypothetical protein
MNQDHLLNRYFAHQWNSFYRLVVDYTNDDRIAQDFVRKFINLELDLFMLNDELSDILKFHFEKKWKLWTKNCFVDR